MGHGPQRSAGKRQHFCVGKLSLLWGKGQLVRNSQSNVGGGAEGLPSMEVIPLMAPSMTLWKNADHYRRDLILRALRMELETVRAMPRAVEFSSLLLF